ncbi:MAG: DUF885 domain-containing protein [Actinomycetia bacterium]|nr:DUF885 domain-containing protein [Actinomycetes bacterium]
MRLGSREAFVQSIIHRRLAFLLFITLSVAACSGTTAHGTTTSVGVPSTSSPAVSSTSASNSRTTTVTEEATAESLGLAGLAFSDFLEDSYNILLLRDPQLLTSLGIANQFGVRNDQLNDYSDEFIRKTQVIERVVLEQLGTFERESLELSEQTSYDVYEWYLDQQVRGHQFMYHDWPVHYFVNSYNFNLLLFLEEEHQINSVEDAEDYISRLNQLERQVGQVVDGLRIRESMGVLPPGAIVDLTVGTLGNDLANGIQLDLVRPETLPLYTSFEERLDQVVGLSEDEKGELLESALNAVEESFAPAWIELRDYMISIRGKAHDDAGVWRLTDGDAYYDHLLGWHTSTDLTPEAVHELGLQQVERVEAEMRTVFDSLGYPSDESLVDLRQSAYREAGFLNGTTPDGQDEVLATHNALISEAEEIARPLFGIWPEAVVEVIPDQGGGGFYIAASFDGSRPGFFHAGTGSQVSLLTLPTVNYHEAVPGHHTQIAITQELDLPTFRRVVHYNAFAEGWALYAERLAWDMGLYDDDPYGNIGRLELELLRAVRLVVDTGIHSLGWSQSEAHAYMDQVIPTMASEVERYMVLPGQATGYMIGQQEILRLRDEARTQLGDDFNIADFHEAVLSSGSLPLSILEQVVNEALSASAELESGE